MYLFSIWNLFCREEKTVLKNYRTFIVMLVVLFTMAGIAYWDDEKTAQEKTEKKTKGLVSVFKKEDVISIQYKRTPKDGEFISVGMVKNGLEWKMLDPFAGTPADKETIDRMLNSLHTLKHSGEVAQSLDKWGQYELDKNNNHIVLEMKDGSKQTFVLGTKSPAGYNMYLGIVESKKAFFVSQTVEATTTKSVFDFRNKSIANFQVTDLIELDSYGKTDKAFKAKKNTDSTGWIIANKTHSKKADEFGIKNIAIAINNENAAEIKDKPDQKFLKAFKNGDKVSLDFTDGKNLKFHFAKIGNDYWVHAPKENIAYKLSADFDKKISKEFNDLRQKRIFEINTDAVTEVVIDSEQYTLKDKKWISKDEAFEKTFILTLLADIKYLDATHFFDKNPTLASNKPNHKLQIKTEDKTTNIHLWKIENDKDSVILWESNTDEYLRTSSSLLSSLSEPKKTDHSAKKNKDTDKL